MSWERVRFDWNRARAFLVAAEEGSFAAAGRSLGIAQPTVGRQVAALEAELGVTLFERVGTRLELTEAGLELVEHVRFMGEAASRMSLAATGQAAAIDGNVVITASELISAHLLPPVIQRLRREVPGVTVEIVASNAIRDLRRREADIAVRNTTSTHPDLIERKLRTASARAYATPAYLATLDDPSTLEGLAQADYFGFADTARMVTILNGFGLPVTRERFPIVSENHLVQWELCKRGIGVCFVMEEVGDRESTVVQLPHLPPLPVPMYLTTHRELRTSRRIRLVFDVLAEMLSQPEPHPR